MRARVGSRYVYDPVFLDLEHSLEPGAAVKVVNLYGCPPANTMGHCYIIRAEERQQDKPPFWLVSTNSLRKVPVAEKQSTWFRDHVIVGIVKD